MNNMGIIWCTSVDCAYSGYNGASWAANGNVAFWNIVQTNGHKHATSVPHDEPTGSWKEHVKLDPVINTRME